MGQSSSHAGPAVPHVQAVAALPPTQGIAGDANRDYFLCLQDVIGPQPDFATPDEEIKRHPEWIQDWKSSRQRAHDMMSSDNTIVLDEVELALLLFDNLDQDDSGSFHKTKACVFLEKQKDSGLNATIYKLYAAYVKLAYLKTPADTRFFRKVPHSKLARWFGVEGSEMPEFNQRAVIMTSASWTRSPGTAESEFRGEDGILIVLEGRPPDRVGGMFRSPITGMEHYKSLPKEGEAQTPPLTALRVIGIDSGYRGKTVTVQCDFSSQVLREMVRPGDEVWRAVKMNDSSSVRQWLGKYPNMDLEFEHPEYKCSLLYSACRFGSLDCAKALVESCAQINSQLSKARSTPFHAATYFDHPNVVQFLLKHLADPTLRNIHDLTPVDEAKAKTKALVSGLKVPSNQLIDGLKLVANATELRYGSRSGFLSGLQAFVGDPVIATMEEEWQGRPSFRHFWSEANQFVVTKGLKLQRNTKCCELNDDELVGCVLYTGNGYKPLNTWLRKLGKAYEEGNHSEVTRLRSREESWACTVFHICSGMQKLTKKNVGCPPLVRGIKGKLPDDFFIPDERGMVTITEYGFMSTSRSSAVADGFRGGGGVTVLMHVEAREEDATGLHNGADLAWLSQFGSEQETLFPPCTIFEVVHRKREEMLVTLRVRPTFLF